MVLGAGMCQVPIIRRAQDMGFEVIAVSIGGDYPGLSLADRSYEVDVRDKERILEIAREQGICGILTDQTDIPVPTVAYVAECLGLPGVSYDCACKFTNKYLMRACAEKAGVPVPGFAKASSPVEARSIAAGLKMPIVVKPVDSQGSRGVTIVNDLSVLDGVVDAALSFSPSSTVILEEFCEGREVVVQGFVSDYRLTNLVIGDRFYFDIPGLFIPKQTLFPSLLPENLKKKVFDINARLIGALAPRFGITHSEYLVDERTGEVRLVETAIRGGGVFISSDLIPLACGIDVNDLIIGLAAGREGVSLDASGIVHRASGYVCFTLPEGVIRKIEGADALRSLKGVHRAHLDDLFVGRRTGKLSDKTMRLGPILITGSGREELDATIAMLRRTLAIEVETEAGSGSIIW
jgi:carbamoyl-phosphate synthase large subunit